MSKLVSSILNYTRPITKYAWIIFLIILFAIVAYYGFRRFAKPVISKEVSKDIANANTRGMNADLYFFHADWCPHCKKASPAWKEFYAEYNGKTVNGYTLQLHDINCTEDSADNSNPAVAEIIQKFNIQGYPTVILQTDDGKKIDFDSKITKKSLETFVGTVL